jgi:hypothetical protein
MSPRDENVFATATSFREQTLQWFLAGDTATGMRHTTEYLPERFHLVRWLLTSPFVLGLVFTLGAGLIYCYLGHS